MRPARRRILVIFGLALLLGVATQVLKVWADARFFEGYDAALPLQATTVSVEERPGYRRIALQFQGLPGEMVPAVLLVPAGVDGPVPSVIYLHGIGQDRLFVEEIAQPFLDRGFAVVSFDQLMCGTREGSRGFRELVDFRRRGSSTVTETRRLVDYLETRPEIAADRIYLLGASYGAIVGAPAASMEPRIRSAVLTFGGAGLRTLLGSPRMRQRLGWRTEPIAWFGAWFLAPMDPARHVGQIAPRAVYLQNGRGDPIIPEQAARRLYQAAREPKSIRWFDTRHIGVDREVVRAVLEDALDWLVRMDSEAAAP